MFSVRGFSPVTCQPVPSWASQVSPVGSQWFLRQLFFIPEPRIIPAKRHYGANWNSFMTSRDALVGMTRVRSLKSARLGPLCVPLCAVRSTSYLPRDSPF